MGSPMGSPIIADIVTEDLETRALKILVLNCPFTVDTWMTNLKMFLIRSIQSKAPIHN